MIKKGILFCLVAGSAMLSFGQGNNYRQNYKKFDSLAMTPPMGWTRWQRLDCNEDENRNGEVWDAMIKPGMKAPGEKNIN